MAPLDPVYAARRFARWLRQSEVWHQERAAQVRAVREGRRTDTAAMRLRWDAYWPGGSYDEMTPPRGVILRLETTHGGWSVLLTERRDDGNREACKAALFERIRAELPHVDPETLPARW